MAENPDSDTTEKRLASLSLPYLSEMARAGTGNPAFEAVAYEYQAVGGGFGGAIGGTAIYRVAILAADGETCELILKILYRRPGEDESSPYYWKREYEIYRAGLLKGLPAATFCTPEMYGFADYDDACWIWMEYVRDTKIDWTLGDYEDVAWRLGRFNGAWLVSGATPDRHWLACNWHAAIVPALSDTFAQLDSLLEHPLAQITLPLAAGDEIKSIWRDRALFSRAIKALPRTFCHNDAFRRNVLHRDGELALIDWALAGMGAIGEDLVSLVAVSLYYAGFTQAQADRLDQAVFPSYIQGLRQAGWMGDEKLARIGYTCGMALRGLAGVKQDIEFLTDATCHDRLRREHNMDSLWDIANLFAEIRRFRLLKMAREARVLLSD